MASTYTRHKRTLIIAKVAIAIIVVAMLVRRIHAAELKSAMLQARILWILPAVLLLGLNLFFQYRRWALLVRRLQPQTPARQIFSSLLSGITLGFITPGRVGEFGRAFLIAGNDWPRLLGLTLLDKCYAFLTLLFFGLIGMLPILKRETELLVWLPLILIALSFFAVLFLLLLHPPFLAGILKKFRKHWENRNKLARIISSLEHVPPLLAIRISLLALSQVLTYLLQFYLLIRAFSPLPLIRGLQALMATLWVKTMLPISIGDLGVRESAAIYFLGELGIPAAAAFDGSLLLFLINVLLPALTGLVLLLRRSAARKAQPTSSRGLP
ncbi:MAG TPA: lysylphosphatidylglycerol synthase transmembrane domain-containing protein [bacterium]|nr:lysylphosphatidylglycerol synthase transmembrane domain-containing protein [bacterium]HPR86642.1 lysylphosphatidylglycerol synthase transmembrane domain-containing protein [bacterium]